jgi:hypothetical protein
VSTSFFVFKARRRINDARSLDENECIPVPLAEAHRLFEEWMPSIEWADPWYGWINSPLGRTSILVEHGKDPIRIATFSTGFTDDVRGAIQDFCNKTGWSAMRESGEFFHPARPPAHWAP